MRATIRSFLCLSLVALPELAPAQAVPVSAMPAGGAEVRVIRPGTRDTVQQVRGKLMRRSGDTVQIRVDEYTVERVVLDEGRVLQVRTGHRTSTVRGLKIGLLTGAVSGAVLGFATYKSCADQETWCVMDPGPGGSALIGAVGLGLVGGVAGLLIGAATWTDTWAPATQPLRASIVPGHGAQVSLTLRF